MAINKNFVIKNGVQVNTDLIVGDSTLNKVGVGTTTPEYTLHVGATKVGGRGGIGATDLNITGVGTIQNFNVLGISTFAGNVQANTGIVSALSFGIGITEVISQDLQLAGIKSLDAVTTNTIEQAIIVGPNSFSDLKVAGISTFVGVATFLGGIDVDHQSGVSTFSANVQFGLGPSAASLVDNFVATGATVGFGTSVFFRDNAAIFMGDGSDFRFYHDNTNSYIDNMTGALFVRNSVDNDDNSSIVFQAKSGENSIVMTNSADESNEVELYYDGSKKLQTTSGGLYVTGITTLSDRLYVEAGISTFVNDVRFGIGATVGFGTSAFFLDDAAITIGDDDDFFIKHSGGHTYLDNRTGHIYVRNSVSSDVNTSIIFQAKSGENSIVMTNSADESNEVELYYDGAKKLQTTSGGIQITGITTLTNRLHVQAGVSTFDADVRFGIGATVGFGTSAFFLDEASIFMGDSDDFELFHDGTDSVIRNRTGDLKLLINNTENGIVIKDNEGVEAYFDNSKKTETTSGGFKVTGITTLTDRLHVQSGISTFDADVRFGIGATVGFGTSAFFRDDAAIFLGNDSDLKVHHDGSNSYIEDVGTGDLILKGSADIKLQSASGESYIVANDTGSVEVYYDNSKKLESTSGGLNITGITTFSDRINVVSGISTFQDSAKLTFGTQSDLIVWHNGSHSYIQDTTGTGNLYVDSNNLVIRNAAGDETQATFVENGGVSLYYDDSKKLESTSGGLNVTGITTFSDRINVVSGVSTFQDSAKLTFGAQSDLIVWHNGSHSYIQDTTGTGNLYVDSNSLQIRNAAGDETQATFAENGAVSLYYDNGNVFQTTPQGINVSGVTTTNRLYVSGISTFLDNAKINLGTGNDLSLWHDATNSYISNNTGELRIDAKTGERAVVGIADSGVHIFFNNAKKLETISTGASVTGDMYISGNLYVSEDISYDEITGRNLNITGITTLAGQTNFGASGVGATVYSNGNVTISGIATIGGDIVVKGNLDVTGDISYDEVTGRNINISGMTTLGSSAGGGVMVTPVGAGATIGNANPAGIVTYYGDGAYLQNLKAGVGIGSTTGLVGYGFTYIHFNGPGVSTVYADARPDFVGYATVFIQGGGSNAGAAGTWTPEGSVGVSTSKSVGVNTALLNNTHLQGVGAGGSFQGLYIGNGMMVVDNQLNGNHYIGTAYNGLMAGPVTVNGVLTVDGNYVVV